MLIGIGVETMLQCNAALTAYKIPARKQSRATIGLPAKRHCNGVFAGRPTLASSYVLIGIEVETMLQCNGVYNNVQFVVMLYDPVNNLNLLRCTVRYVS